MTDIEVAVRDGVAVVTLNGPATRNALDVAAATELVRACERIDADPAIGAVVVRGAPPAFCSGADRALLAAAAADPASTESVTALQAVYDAFVRVGRLRPPTIAAVTGDAVGAGLNLALATDVRIMANDARLVSGFLRIGVHPGGGHFALLARLVGRERAAALTLLGIPLDGRRAAEVGIAAECHDAADVEPRAAELATALAANPTLARSAVSSLRLAYGPPQLSWEAALEAERGRQLWSLRDSATFRP